ncbi:hypothetical protein CGZ95_11735 [Enemella evansiae]|uniref:sugar ABC transporter ATP-binding protein n=1 Tax=Enemella evansiae TaxID=2016499 RepID=UPI000B96D95C|nr:sugar ABC transporter ATP-binding protein [Enemella evansiae]OYN98747.1 hypothetical protein CGZ95_11735 [Enemella evansiae]
MGDTHLPLLELRDIRKSFAGVQALDGVSLTVRGGRVLALLGENGAGKSTLINVMSGVFTDYQGSVHIDGAPVALTSPTVAQQHGIATIHQELNLVPDLSIADNIWLGREPATLGWVRRRDAQQAAGELLARVGLQLNPRRLIRQCRLAEQQLVEVAKAISLDARVVIMDEPTSALAEAEVERLFGVVRSLTAAGVGIVYVSHRLAELEEIADEVTVLRDGAWVGHRRMADTSRPELIKMMVGRSVRAVERRDTMVTNTETHPRLVVEKLSLRGNLRESRAALHEISLTVRPGEIVGLAGLMGAGRTEILESIFGLFPAADVSGEVYIDGTPLRRRTPRHAIRHGVALVAEDRKAQSLVLGGSVRFNASLAALRRFSTFGWINRRVERTEVAAQLGRLRTKSHDLTTPVRTLSGGNQQKVVLGKWLLTSPKVILLDEPTRGIDVGAKAEIYEIVQDLAGQGVAVLVVSSELPELLGICDRILVIREGGLSAEFTGPEATQESLLSAAMPAGGSNTGNDTEGS